MYPVLYSHRDSAEAEAALDSFGHYFDGRSPILDLASGDGRYLEALLRREVEPLTSVRGVYERPVLVRGVYERPEMVRPEPERIDPERDGAVLAEPPRFEVPREELERTEPREVDRTGELRT